jgi:hypothetical protein
MVRFKPLEVEEFIDYAYVNIAPIWVGKVLRGVWINNLFEVPDLQEVFNSSNTKAREGITKDIVAWRKFSYSCFIPHGNVNDWSHGIYKLKDFLLLPSIIADTRFNRLESEDNLKIVTAYHSSIKKRIIVDGFHRAAALEAEVKNRQRIGFPKVTIWECYGKLVHTIFPFEFSHLLTPYIPNQMHEIRKK